MNFATGQTFATALAALGFAGTTSYLWPTLWRHNRMRRIQRQLATDRILALTYDDGPSSVMTLQLLDLLRRRAARATFFMLGRNAERYPGIVAQIVKDGHEVGCHSYDHINAWNSGPYSAIRDVQKGYARLSEWVPPNGMFRPPHGKMNLFTYLVLRRRRAPVWWWTIDSGDTRRRMPKLSQVTELLRREKGGIVLMHDLDRDDDRNRFVLDLTEGLLDTAKKESLRVTTLGELGR